MFNSICKILAALSSLLSFGDADANTTRQTANTTNTVLTTIFQGDVKQSDEFLKMLAGHYRSFLGFWVAEGYCTETIWGNAAHEACKVVQATEIKHINKGNWTQGFSLSKAEFNRSLGDKNIGTYNFTRSIKVLPQYSCIFTMQITAILNDPDHPTTQEFFAKCSAR